MVWAAATCSICSLEMLQRCALSSRGSQRPRRAWLPPPPQPTTARDKLPPAEPGPAAASGSLLLALSPNPTKPKTKWKVSQSAGEKRNTNPAASRADQLAWASGNNRGQEAGRKFLILFQAVGRRDESRVNCSNTAHLRDVTFKPPLRFFWRNSGLTTLYCKCCYFRNKASWKVLINQLPKHRQNPSGWHTRAPPCFSPWFWSPLSLMLSLSTTFNPLTAPPSTWPELRLHFLHGLPPTWCLPHHHPASSKKLWALPSLLEELSTHLIWVCQLEIVL